MLKEKLNIYIVYAILALTIYFIFFQHLDSFHLRNWDESMYAVNAYEMSRNHNFIVPYFKGFPDLWNSKPPLQIWFQVLFIKLIGLNELAVRLPSALASSFSALLLFQFFKKRISINFALCVFFVFVSCKAVSDFHTGRTGDADALLSFFILCYFVEYYKWLFENKNISLLYFFIFLSLAFLTKSLAALLFIPAFIFITLYFKKTSKLLFNKWFYLGSFFFLILSAGFLILRECYNPGYIKYVLNNDFGRISTVIESHEEPFDFYFNQLFESRFLWVILVIPGAMILYFNLKTRPWFTYLTSLFISYFLIISYSTTKLEWYDLPLMPILSVLAAVSIHLIISKINTSPAKVKWMILGIFILPIYFSCRKSYKSEIKQTEKRLESLSEYAFKHINDGTLNNSIFLTDDYDRAIYFYKYSLNEKGGDFKVTSSIENIHNGSFIIVSDDSLKNEITKNYAFDIKDSILSAWKIEIKSTK